MPLTFIVPESGPSGTTAEPKQPSASQGPTTGPVSPEDALGGAKHTEMGGFSATEAKSGSDSTGGTSVPLGNLIQGKHATELIDAIVPALLVVLFKKLGLDVRKSEMQLTEKEKNTLAPVVEACMNSIMLNFNSPWVTLGVSLGIIYGSKAIEHGGVKWMDKSTSSKKSQKDITDEVIDKSKARMQSVKTTEEAVRQSVNTQSPATDEMPLSPWTEDDIKKVDKKRRKGRKEAIQWLEKNWKKIGGQL